MRLWKRLLGTALCLCAAVCVMSVGASAADHTHPICGETHTDIGDHTGPCGDVTWTEVTQKDVTDNNGELKLEAGQSYYLGENIQTTKTITITGTVSLCLNGKTLNSQYTVIEVTGGATLNICDCRGGGKITNTSQSNSLIKVDPDYNGTATLNLYGGKVSGSVNSDGVVMLYNNAGDQKDNTAIFNMYGGEVCNTGSGIFVSYSHVGTGFFGVNIYGGTVASENTYGIDSSGSSNATVLVAGGEIKGYFYAIQAIGNLKLSGSPLIHADEDKADIGIITGPASTPNDYITVADDFALVNGATISVYKSIGITGSVLIAKPETGKPLDGKAGYFVAADKGYFVESKNGELYLTACAITEEPAVGNGYTVTANGSPTYQWYSATKGPVPVTDAVVKSEGDLSYWYGEWSTHSIPQSGEVTGFTLTMKKDDMLTLDFSRSEVWVERVAFSDGQRTITGVEDKDHWRTYTLTAPADGDYTLKISYVGDEGAYLQFTAKVTADVPDKELSGQTAATLNTTGLSGGSYICRVTWEGKTTLNSQVVSYTAPQHTHRWSTDWTSDATNHWHKCFICNDKNDIVAHTYDQEVAVDGYKKSDATCTAKATYYKSCVCGAKGTEMFESGGLLAHDFTGGTWKSDANNHWKNCANCDAESDKVQHNFSKSGNTYTCIACGYAYTVPSPSSSSGGSSTPTITVPVSGSGDTVHVSASVSGSTAEVKEIKRTELDKIGTDSAVVIDLSGLNKGVTGVTLSTNTIDSICKTEADGVTIKLPSAELRVDRQTLAAVTEQAAGSKLRLVVESDGTARSTMTAAQKSTLAGMKNAAALEAYFVSGGTRIRDFKGGSVELSIPYRADGAIRAWFLKEDGTREPVSARYDKENAQLILHHFSHYVIEELDSSAAYTVCAKDDSCPIGAFGDLTAAAWYHDGVHYCLENGLMRGASGGKFLPDGSTTRAQLVTILWRLEGSPETTGAVRFGDTAGGAWYTEAVRWAAGCGVVKGYDNGCFGPNDAVTREQMAAILYRYAQHKGYDVSAGKDTNILSFNDAFAVSEYAIPAMQWACGSGMVRGIAQKGGMFLAPGDTTTRAQAATLIMRFQSAFAKEP